MATPAITIKQPWAYAVAHGHKNVENRSKPPPKAVLNQRVAIHAGKAIDQDAQHFPPMARLLDSPEGADAECVQGAVIGFAKVVGW